MPRDFRFKVDPVTKRAPAGHPASHSTAVKVGSKGQPFDGVAFASNHPRCIRCGAKARPAVKMFNDSESYMEPTQASHYDWMMTMENVALEITRTQGGRKARFVVLEVGVGANVPTLRHISKKNATELGEGEAEASVTLIRVNPKYPESEHELDPSIYFIPLMEGGLEACEAIESIIKEKTRSATATAAAAAAEAEADSK